MKKTILSLFFVCAFQCLSFASAAYDVAAIVWPAYHPAPRWKELGIFNHGNGEWQNVYEAKPKFKGHNQPLVPLWGYENEADPIAVARKIDAALAAGVNIFMYDWYWYGGRPFLEDALNKGFLGAPNNERMKFFLMWANHDVNGLWNNKIGGKEKSKVIWPADVSYDEFVNVLVPRWISYFKKPNYYKIDNKPVLGIFDLKVYVRGMGSPETAKAALEYLRKACKDAGFDGLYFVSIGGSAGLNAPIPGKEKATWEDVFKYYGFDAMSMYNWEGITVKKQTYAQTRDENIAKWDVYKDRFSYFIPTVSTGWDTNPRFIQSELKQNSLEKSPAEYEKALRSAKAWLDKNVPDSKPKFMLINAWNEWTEGEYLEPDTTYGYEYLNATARVFGGAGQAK